MDQNKINIIEFDKRKSPVTQLAKMIEEAFKIFKGAELLIVNRKAKGDFFEVIAESLYEYEKGVVLIERFFRKKHCSQKGMEYKKISDSDKDIIKEFSEFSKQVPEVSTLSEEEKDDYTNKLNEYTEKIKNINPEVAILDTFQYKKFSLVEFDLIDDKTLEITSNLYAGFSINFLTAMSWASLEDVSIALTTVEHKDYIDLIIVPILINKNSEN